MKASLMRLDPKKFISIGLDWSKGLTIWLRMDTS